MSPSEAAALEALLARLYVDRELRARFLADPHATARGFGLSAEHAECAAAIDKGDLELFAESLEHRRAGR